MSFYTAAPLLTAHPIDSDEFRGLCQAWAATPFVVNYAYRVSHAYRFAGRKDLAAALVDIAFGMQHDRPDAVLFRAEERIRRSDFGGWAEYQTRFADPAFRQGHQYERWFGDRIMWDGREDLSGKSLLVVQEQGMGDTIQVLRYLKVACGICPTVYAHVHPSLYRLVQATYGDILAHHDPREGLPVTDRHIGIMSLPGIFGPLPAHAMRLPLPKTMELSGLPNGTGLVWRGNPKNRNDANRSMDRPSATTLFETLRAGAHDLGQVTGYQVYGPFYSFQRGAGEDWFDGNRLVSTHHLTPPGDWLSTAIGLQRVERLVTIDSAVMHLAGSLDIETWCLLCYAHDWRFPETGDMPEWYPSVRFIRQPVPGDWDGAIADLMRQLSTR